ncbi:hypothetical protein CU102_12350 [Phyllobacterium brassicacearum]|uniref:Uncharacterized protein n=1 Tax=Phyllobacterium brassicacearum TaxID=314235 RepID=A0A2P7BPZ7_9HYPH|nr:hypothetical protein [Phyllobacterium brassicacearum]PSH68548.1 hypothetical protein CU102_12350 [Phyllobacterium brassicacearum]TDQ19897.1 hypothetical protein DEV91_12492 [Phyllobacterium brassicacearum]
MSVAELTPPEHEHSDIVEEAARFYATTPRDYNQPGVVVLRERFGLTALQACEALRMAQLIKARSL